MRVGRPARAVRSIIFWRCARVLIEKRFYKLLGIVGYDKTHEIIEAFRGQLIKIPNKPEGYGIHYLANKEYFDSLPIKRAAYELGCTSIYFVALKKKFKK